MPSAAMTLRVASSCNPGARVVGRAAVDRVGAPVLVEGDDVGPGGGHLPHTVGRRVAALVREVVVHPERRQGALRRRRRDEPADLVAQLPGALGVVAVGRLLEVPAGHGLATLPRHGRRAAVDEAGERRVALDEELHVARGPAGREAVERDACHQRAVVAALLARVIAPQAPAWASGRASRRAPRRWSGCRDA